MARSAPTKKTARPVRKQAVRPRKRAVGPRRDRFAEYRARRDFGVTPEPPPAAAAPSSGRPTFMIHKHHASRLHYDLRLEMDGALASWSVPKGPSFDPSVKRLAVQTEDHPLEYGQFEGRIPDGEYGAGDSLIWDRGTYETVPPQGPGGPASQASAQRKKGHLHVIFFGEKLKGRWHLVRTRGGQGGKPSWILFKASDEMADPKHDVVEERPESVVSGRVHTRGPETAGVLRAVHPPPDTLLAGVEPMLATLVAGPPADEDRYVFELKYDGFRAVCGLSSGRVAMVSRNALDLTTRFPAIAKALSRIVVGDAVLDGEIVALDAQGAPRFQLLQAGREEAIYCFDLLRLDGRDLRDRPLEERRDLLVSLLENQSPAVRVAERVAGRAAGALEEARRRGYEGILAKLRGSIYESGKRSRAWLKIKAEQAQELAIIGFTPHTRAPDEIGALLLGVVEDGALRYAGKVGTGFTSKMRASLKKKLERDVADEPPAAGAPRMRDATWVRPKLAAQVRFTEWTEDGKLRHPAFLGLRDDKSPLECVRERPAAASTKAAPKPTAKTQAKGSTRTARGRKHAGDADDDAGGAPPGDPTGDSAADAVRLTNPDRVYWPRDGLTKGDLAAYYDAVAEPLLRAIADRPLTLEHWNRGIDHPSWFHQNVDDAPPWARVVEVVRNTKRGSGRKLIADRPETLRWLAQNGVLTIHCWNARTATPTMPDQVVFDFDPADGHGIEQTIEPALALRALFEQLSIPSVPKTSGKRGLHVLVPLRAGHTFEDALDFALQIGSAMARRFPETVTLERSKSMRKGRLYLDCMQNAYAKTIVAPYSPRAVDGAPVSAPLTWDEVHAGLDPRAYNLRTMPARLAARGDLFRPVLEQGIRLPRFK